ncbi:HesA/MoeB/ThiF family protein [Desulfosporosinus meridiei]|uniref:Dinucleotide-utilizing enzyme possibly involved in molybdopterin or thiamin biosynthesis n=1 Tax=Desulfosporosinus meridiei (strain ATCC BAA-275 / DSM 13257 / KCTC 12902 / NCIMB 13706 / S10) TaxID=768704 RepID=J7IWW0_DESMD|nr:HesA/MoeB/ThiF family protein [Desulfosporosinus meridiei]AFQ43201.1 dinucleotide-utilizing enzyme possibly involved in molybdopterin or thiamin biosynthesis [Desulfosporosinus meridiei DSM 13257]
MLEGRYVRNKETLTDQDQNKLLSSSVAIVGCGGLGGYIAEELARIGVRRIVLIDGDRLEVSNLNRQIMATEETIGQWKVEAARDRLQRVNSEVKVEIIKEWFAEERGRDFFSEVDLVFDALDSLAARVVLERVCHQLKLPLVFASIAGWYGQIGVSLPGDFSVLRLYGHGERGVESKWGNPAFTPAVVASLSVAEGVKLLIGRIPALRRAWLQVDLLTMEFERFELPSLESL